MHNNDLKPVNKPGVGAVAGCLSPSHSWWGGNIGSFSKKEPRDSGIPGARSDPRSLQGILGAASRSGSHVGGVQTAACGVTTPARCAAWAGSLAGGGSALRASGRLALSSVCAGDPLEGKGAQIGSQAG